MKHDSPNKSRVAIYARVSSDEQKQGQTIDSQIAELVKHAELQSWSIVDVYKDEGWSGSLIARPELDRLRDDAAASRFSRVLVNDVDRLARDVTHLGIIKRDLEKSEVELVFRKLPAEKSPTYNLMVNILGSFAEFEREMILDRTRRGRRHHIEVRQKILGSRAPYGYRYIRKDRAVNKDGFLEIVPEEAAVIRQIYDWIDTEGLSLGKVLTRLNGSKMQPRNSQLWAKSSLGKLVHNETYAGIWHYNKHFSCEPKHRKLQSRYRPPKSSNRLRPRKDWWPVRLDQSLIIIQRPQWERVQKQIACNISLSPRNSKNFYLLKGLLRCGACASAYIGDPGKGIPNYRCVSRCKKLPSIKCERLDQAIWCAVEEVVLNPQLILPEASRRRSKQQEHESTKPSELHSLQKSLNLLMKEEDRVVHAYRTGIFTPAQLGQELQKIHASKSALKIRVDELKKEEVSDLSLQSVADFCSLAAVRLRSFSNEARQRFLNLIINEVVIEGETIRIHGIIPHSPSNESAEDGIRLIPPAAHSPTALHATIESTMTYRRGLNSNRTASTTLLSRVRNYSRPESTTSQRRGPNNLYEHVLLSHLTSEIGIEFQLRKELPSGRILGKQSQP